MRKRVKEIGMGGEERKREAEIFTCDHKSFPRGPAMTQVRNSKFFGPGPDPGPLCSC